jgi:hypothetical protein
MGRETYRNRPANAKDVKPAKRPANAKTAARQKPMLQMLHIFFFLTSILTLHF